MSANSKSPSFPKFPGCLVTCLHLCVLAQVLSGPIRFFFVPRNEYLITNTEYPPRIPITQYRIPNSFLRLPSHGAYL